MKKLRLTLCVIALVIGLSHCTRPVVPEVGVCSGETKEITFSSGDGSKVVIDNSILNELKFIWESEDVIHVYGSADGTFSDGQYCGELAIVGGAGTQEGRFNGKLNNVPSTGKLRFCYFAGGFDAETHTAAIDLSSQDGDLNALEDKLVAMVTLDVNPSGSYGGSLEVPYSIAKFDLSSFGTNTVTMSGHTNAGFTINSKGEYAVTPGASTSLSGASVGSTGCFTAVMPENVEILSFSGNSMVGNIEFEEFTGNSFYTTGIGGNTGDPIEIPAVTPAPKPSSVTTFGGCNSSQTYSFGGEVKVSQAQRCELGLVYSTTVNPPTLGTTGCDKEYVIENVPAGTNEFSIDVTGMSEGSTYYVRAYAIGESGETVYGSVKSGVIGGDKPLALPDNWNGGGTTGASPYEFSVNKKYKVRFSRGNLQYIGSAATPYWQFAEHQFDIIGSDNYSDIDNDQSKDRDLLGWATSGQTGGQKPWWTNTGTISDYYAYGSYNKNLDTQTPATADWGYNAITNGGNTENSGWRTLTKTEWNYLLSTTNKSKWGMGKIGNCTRGMIILPDSWTTPSGLSFTSGVKDNYTTNVYTYAQWSRMEEAGAVFLPCGGVRWGKSGGMMGGNGSYWSSTYYTSDTDKANFLQFYDGAVKPQDKTERSRGLAVRLVR